MLPQGCDLTELKDSVDEGSTIEPQISGRLNKINLPPDFFFKLIGLYVFVHEKAK